MARYRPLYKSFWKDADIQELVKDDKLLVLYLFNNEAVTESGIYHITPRTIANETDITLEYVKQRLANHFYRNILYDAENKLIFVKKIRKYGTGGAPNLIAKSILADYNLTSYSNLWQDFIIEYPQYKQMLNGCVTVDEPLETTPETPEVPPDDTKVTFEEYVESLRADPDYKSINFNEELKKFNLYWGEGKRKLKRPKFALRNWLNNALKYDKEKVDGTHQRHSGKVKEASEFKTPKEHFGRARTNKK